MMRFSRTLWLLALVALPAARIARAQDTTYRGITINGVYDPTRDKYTVVVLPVTGAFGDSIQTIVKRDLDFSDHFTLTPIDSTDPSALKNAGSAAGLNYPLFQHLGVQAIVQMTIVPTGLHVALHDVTRGAVVNVKEFALAGNPLSRDWRLSIHQVSDEVTRWVTGQRGIAATRIAYLRGGSIRVIDSDGASEITLPTEPNAMSPAWNPAATMIAYSTYAVNSRIVLMDLATGQSHTLVGPTRNTSYTTPVFTPDGSRVVYTRAGETESDLYAVGVSGGPRQRLTAGSRGVEESLPTVSPDGRRIVFVSNALGRPELYIMDSDGTNADVLTNYDFSEKNYRTDPDWSPDGRLIAYAERINDRFQIRTIPITGGTPKQLTSDGENEQPSWAPDGRHLVFTSSRTGVRQLWILDTESNRVRQLTKSAGSRLPAWSARLGAGGAN
ncbi:MAG TPA: hypothetical protein VHB25_18920 [Gemmatimonadaceae bacterium]|nr:hypothetical protein [Gemmatimonadaceae bacterium]